MIRMRGGAGYFLLPEVKSKNGTEVAALASVGRKETYIVFAAVNPDLEVNTAETYEFRIPQRYFSVERISDAEYVTLTRDNALHDRIREDFEETGCREKKFIDASLRCGDVRQMAMPRQAGLDLVNKNMRKYEKMWIDALTRRKLPANKVTVKSVGGFNQLKIRLAPPEIFVLIVNNL